MKSKIQIDEIDRLGNLESWRWKYKQVGENTNSFKQNQCKVDSWQEMAVTEFERHVDFTVWL